MSHKSWAIWPVFLIAFYWSCQITKADGVLPQNIEEATKCLREYMGDKFVPKSFLDPESPPLLPGEYLQEFCREEDMYLINKKVLNDTEGHGEEVQKCLRDLGKEYVYDKFFKSGKKQLDDAIAREEAERTMDTDQSKVPPQSSSKDGGRELEMGEIDEDDDDDVDDGKNDEPTGDRKSSPQLSPIRPSEDVKPPALQASQTIGDKSGTPQVPQASTSEDPKQSVALVDTTSSENLPGEEKIPLSKIVFPDLTKFSFGLCFGSPKFNFDELQDVYDKKDTFDCITKCEISFFDKLKYIISDGRRQVLLDLKSQYAKLMEKQSKTGESKQPKETETTAKPAEISPAGQSDVTDSLKRKTIDAGTSKDQNETTTPPRKKTKVDPAEVLKNIEYFESNTEIKEEKDAFKRALEANIIAKLKEVQAKSKTPVSNLEFEDIDMLTTTGIEFLKNYSEFYADVYRFLKEDDLGPDVDLTKTLAVQNQPTDNDAEPEEKKETIRGRLHNSFFFYTGCAKKQCHMESKKSIPLDAYIQEEAQDLDENAQIAGDDAQNAGDDAQNADDDDNIASEEDTDTPTDMDTVIPDSDTKLQQSQKKERTSMRIFAKVLTKQDPDDPDSSSSESNSDED